MSVLALLLLLLASAQAKVTKRQDTSPSPTSNTPPAPSSANGDPSSSAPSPSASPSPKKKKDPCADDGLCNGCVALKKTGICPGFVDTMLPLDLSAYFKATSPTSSYVPPPIQSPYTDFDNMWSNFSSSVLTPWSFKEFGCTSVGQKWLVTWFCLDMIDFYRQANDQCATSSAAPQVCPSFFDDRASSMTFDLNNSTICPIGAEAKTRGLNYINTKLTQSPYRASDPSNCIDTSVNEGYAATDKCGYYYEGTPCLRHDCTSPGFVQTIQPNCSQYSALVNKLMLGDQGSPSSPSSSVPVMPIVFGVLGAVIIGGGIFMLSRVRVRSAAAAALKKTLGRSTSTRSKADMASGSGAAAAGADAYGASAPAVPPVPATYHQQPQSGYMQQPVYSNNNNNMSAPHLDLGHGVMSPMGPAIAAAAAVGSGAAYAATPGTPAASAPPNSSTPQTVTVAYQATQSDELTMTPGDAALVFESYEDGWAFGRNLITGSEGFFPLTCFQVLVGHSPHHNQQHQYGEAQGASMQMPPGAEQQYQAVAGTRYASLSRQSGSAAPSAQ
ncbi:hypothetical protein RI367_002412 [Sorochytrium milnesiophthora]